MKNSMVKKIVAGVAAVAIMMGSLVGTTTTAHAKGIGFTHKKVSTITPKVASVKRVNSESCLVTVKMPVKKAVFSDVKGKKVSKPAVKFSKKNINVRFGSSAGNKFEGFTAKARVKSVKGNTVTLSVSDQMLGYFKNTYFTVSWSANKAAKTAKTNWSKLVKTDNGKCYGYKAKGSFSFGKTILKCNVCGKTWDCEKHLIGNVFSEEVEEHSNQHIANGEAKQMTCIEQVYIPSPKDIKYNWLWID